MENEEMPFALPNQINREENRLQVAKVKSETGIRYFNEKKLLFLKKFFRNKFLFKFCTKKSCFILPT